jgi:hypothetical protein
MLDDSNAKDSRKTRLEEKAQQGDLMIHILKDSRTRHARRKQLVSLSHSVDSEFSVLRRRRTPLELHLELGLEAAEVVTWHN